MIRLVFVEIASSVHQNDNSTVTTEILYAGKSFSRFARMRAVVRIDVRSSRANDSVITTDDYGVFGGGDVNRVRKPDEFIVDLAS